ncbi:MAG: ChbG/HpnK family deacetylase [Thomasclavelia sp.]|nr:ChbG/HpnK family deacetylase [Thomasclavelia sp.]
MNKKIIINSDDFGLTRGVNYGILDSWKNKSISAISMMVNAPEASHAFELIKENKMDCVGVHVNVTLGIPVSNPDNVPSLIDETGKFHSSKWYLAGNQINEDELILEFDIQIQKFIKETNMMPDHINYHHIYDFYNEYPKLFNFLVNKYHLPMRLERDYENYPYQYVSKKDLFINFDKLDLSAYLTQNLVELPAHIGFCDKQLMNISSMNTSRMDDYDLANSKEFKDLYTSLGYELVGWKEIDKK